MTWNDNDRLRAQVTRAAEAITQRKFCTACQSMKPPEGGLIKPMRNGRAKRWVCSGCVSRWKSRT